MINSPRRGVVGVLCAGLVISLASACTGGDSGPIASPRPNSATTAAVSNALQPVSQRPSDDDTVLTGTSSEQAAATAKALFASAPVVVAAAGGDPAAMAAAGPLAVKLGVPLLPADTLPGLVKPLHIRKVVTVGSVTLPAGVEQLAAPAGTLPSPAAIPSGAGSTSPAAGTASSSASSTASSSTASSTTPPPSTAPSSTAASSAPSGTATPSAPVSPVTTAQLPDPLPADLAKATVKATSKLGSEQLAAPAAQDAVTVLVRPDDPAAYAASATARAAGATVVMSTDPRSPDVLATMKGRGDDPVIVLSSPWTAKDARYVVQAAAAGPVLPGKGALILDHRYIALYGYPNVKSLGVLGEQDVPATISRAEQVAGSYQGLATPSVVPTLEMMATVASGTAGSDGDYSQESSVEKLTPLIDAAGKAGQYVVLDLQPGRARLLDQAKMYQSLLERPYVALALDPEWKLKPDQVPLKQIGSVDVSEINEVVTWLADLTRDKALPQKMLLLHQFRLSMIRNRDNLDTSRPELQTVIQMDGQGGQSLKNDTWKTIRAGAPAGVVFGWKNFYDEDSPTLTPAQTMNLEPTPWYVSYQ